MGKIIGKEFANVMTSNMKLYADEVNEQRAIPSIYDGLKPVQRRVLYWLGLNKGDKNYLGSAEITGGVLGSFHPHGDSSVYGALVRMSQPLIMSYPLIDFHGNNGSLTDPPAAMRYTKAKLSEYGLSLLTDINVPGVIDWGKNYLETIDEPKYLLGTLGTLNLLINPQIGIGVGLASNFTCHNINDIKALVKFRMEHPNCLFNDLPELYPSFHNAGVLVNKSEISNIYKSGTGKVVLRGKYHWENDCLIIDEMPYRTEVSSIKKYLIKHPYAGVGDIFEQGGKLKIYVDRSLNRENFEAMLLKKTALQTSYAVNMTATDLKGKPKVWTLLEILDTHIALQHRRITKVAEHKRNNSLHGLHISEGIIKALDDIDEVIKIIRNSESSALAKTNLMNQLDIDEEQAKAILDIKLARLARLEIDSVRKQIEDYKIDIELQTSIIESKEKREQIYINEIASFNDNGKHTEIYDLVQAGVDGEVVNKDCYIKIDNNNSIKIDYEDFEGAKKLSLNENLYIITSSIRGFKKPVKCLKLGSYNADELVTLKDKGEKVISIVTDSDIKSSSFTVVTDKYDMHFDISILKLGASPRGKKLTTVKDMIGKEVIFE